MPRLRVRKANTVPQPPSPGVGRTVEDRPCACGHGWRHCRSYFGVWLCLAKCWRWRKSIRHREPWRWLK